MWKSGISYDVSKTCMKISETLPIDHFIYFILFYAGNKQGCTIYFRLFQICLGKYKRNAIGNTRGICLWHGCFMYFDNAIIDTNKLQWILESMMQ